MEPYLSKTFRVSSRSIATVTTVVDESAIDGARLEVGDGGPSLASDTSDIANLGSFELSKDTVEIGLFRDSLASLGYRYGHALP